MLGNFSYSNPTKLYFGEDSLNYLNEELPRYGENIMLAYGGGSIYYRYICPYGLKKFRRYAINVWDVDPDGKTDEQVAAEGLVCMETWMEEIGLVMHLKELGVTEDMLEGIAKGSFIMEGGYKVLTQDKIVTILKDSM